MKSNRVAIYICVAVMLPMLWACKPTEQGYRKAYELAKQKEREGIDDETYQKMVEASKPPMIEVDGVKMRQIVQFVTLIYPDEVAKSTQLKRYNPAVGVYKMVFNAKAHTDRLRADGLPAVMLKDPESKYYVCLGTFDTQSEAAAAADAYNHKYPSQFVSIEEPLLVVTAR